MIIIRFSTENEGLFEALGLDEINQAEYSAAAVMIDTVNNQVVTSVIKNGNSQDVDFGEWSSQQENAVDVWKEFISEWGGEVELYNPSEEERRIADMENIKIQELLSKKRLTKKDVKLLEKNGYNIITRPGECQDTIAGKPYIAHIYKGEQEIAKSLY